MLCWEMIAVSSEIRIEHINTLCGQNVEFVSVKPGGYSTHWTLEGFIYIYIYIYTVHTAQ